MALPENYPDQLVKISHRRFVFYNPSDKTGFPPPCFEHRLFGLGLAHSPSKSALYIPCRKHIAIEVKANIFHERGPPQMQIM
jgi:hypothetical protein